MVVAVTHDSLLVNHDHRTSGRTDPRIVAL